MNLEPLNQRFPSSSVIWRQNLRFRLVYFHFLIVQTKLFDTYFLLTELMLLSPLIQTQLLVWMLASI